LVEASPNQPASQAGGSERNDDENSQTDDHVSRAQTAQNSTASDADSNSTVAATSTDQVGDQTSAATESSTNTDIQSCTRKRAREGLMRQAERMIKRSKIMNKEGNVGDNVTIPIPMYDRGRGDPRNLIGIIVDRDQNDMYTIAVRAGILKGKYSRNQFDLCTQKLHVLEEFKTDADIELRQAVQHESLSGGQGFVKCNCTGRSRCEVNRCKCFKAGVKCNSRCHSTLSCANKT